jgi:hypothetical protein
VPVANQTAVYKAVPRKVLNKVTLNFINAPSVTSQLVKSNLGFINNNVPEIDLVNEGVPALCYAVKDTACIEAMLTASLSTKEASLINSLKEGKFEVAPKGLISAFKAGKLVDFMAFKIRQVLGVNEVREIKSGSGSNSGLDF